MMMMKGKISYLICRKSGINLPKRGRPRSEKTKQKERMSLEYPYLYGDALTEKTDSPP
jgi:hypothetical protein